MWKITATSALCLLLASGLLAAPRHHHTWTMTQVLAQGSLIAMTNSGRFLGELTAGDRNRPFLWHHGHWSFLPEGFEPEDVNDSGQVVGALSTGGPRRAAGWDRGRLIDLGTWPGDTSSIARAVNNREQVVGSSRNDLAIESPQAAILWDRGTAINLGSLGCCHSEALDINDAGHIVGWSETDGESYHAFAWVRGTIMRLPQPAPGPYSAAVAINNRGQAVGWSTSFDGITRAVLWDRGTPIDLVPGATYATAAAINERGQVVGFASDGLRSGAFVWDKGILTVLPSDTALGDLQPVDINNRGHIIGTAGVLWTR